MGFIRLIWLVLPLQLLLIAVCPNGSAAVPKTLWFPVGTGKFLPVVGTNAKLNQLLLKASPSDDIHVHFLLYTRKEKHGRELFTENGELLQLSSFDKNLPTKIVIHGFTQNAFVGIGPVARKAYFESTNAPPVNLIVVDWGKLAEGPMYNNAAGNTRLVGTTVAKFIEFLVAEGHPLDRIHVVGHSLGSHVAGFAGSKLNGMTLPRITALDPALPLFESASDQDRIDPTDADYVDVIHTAGGSVSALTGKPTSLAFIEPRGHADFYPNGGSVQPGCGLDLSGVCSHLRAYDYYFESVTNPSGFPACACRSWEEYQFGKCSCLTVAYMGEASSSSRGMFYLRTKAVKPYASNAI